MKVIFLQHVINVGKVGEVKEVSTGYARNFLLPKGLAKEFTIQEEKSLKEKNRKIEENRRHIMENRNEIHEMLNGTTLEFQLSKTQGGKTFGAVGEKDIIDSLEKKYKLHFTKSDIELPNGHIKKIGKQDIFVKIGGGTSAKILVTVTQQ